jgi:hypothetical protein
VNKYDRAGRDADGNVIWRMRFACWITKATHTHAHTHTHTEYVIIIVLPQQQWLRVHASMLRVYIHCLPCVY